jgi:hypothetical protein
VHYADLHPAPAMIQPDQSCPAGERGLHYGGPGCPGVAEFAVAEYAVVLGLSTITAAKNIGQALALRHRLPLIWDRVLARKAIPWRAREVATATMALSLEAAALVDRRVAPIINSVGPVQLRNIVKAALWEADPEAAQATAEQKARERGVWIGRSDDHGTSTVFVKADTGSVITFNATINQIAEALTTLEGPAPHQSQRSRAFAVLSDPALSHLFLQVAQHLATQKPTSQPESAPDPGELDPPRRPRVEPLDRPMAEVLTKAMDAATRDNLAGKLFALKAAADKAGRGGSRPASVKLYVHLTDETLLAGQGTTRIEAFGPAYTKLAELLGHDRVVIQPVIDLNEGFNVNAYEIPTWLRERVKLSYPVEQFPYGAGETTDRTDLDHVIPYDPHGPEGQTSTDNLRPLRRRSHRIKTLAGWTEQTDGNATQWTTRHGYKFRVDQTGTHPIHP